MVLRGLTTIWSLAMLPTSRSPFSLTATTLGRMSEPLSLGTTLASLLRTYATHVLVVPRSMPRIGLLSLLSRATALSRGARSRLKKNSATRGEEARKLVVGQSKKILQADLQHMKSGRQDVRARGAVSATKTWWASVRRSLRCVRDLCGIRTHGLRDPGRRG